MQSTKAFVIFLIVAISIYTLINTYVYFRGFAALSGEGRWVISLKILFAAVVLAFPVSVFFRNTSYCQVCNVLTIVGSVWMGAMLYFFLIAFASDIVRLVQILCPLHPAHGSRQTGFSLDGPSSSGRSGWWRSSSFSGG